MGIPLSHADVAVTEQLGDIIQTSPALQHQRRKAVPQVMHSQTTKTSSITSLSKGGPQVIYVWLLGPFFVGNRKSVSLVRDELSLFFFCFFSTVIALSFRMIDRDRPFLVSGRNSLFSPSFSWSYRIDVISFLRPPVNRSS